MSENLGNIEYHKGWVLEKNPEPDKLHNKFAWAEKHGVQISIGPNDLGMGDGLSESTNRRLDEMFSDIETIQDVKELFKNELFHNSDAYSKEMKKAMSICITRLHESIEDSPTGLEIIIEFLERFIDTASKLDESEETDNVLIVAKGQADEAKNVAIAVIERGIKGNVVRQEFDKIDQLLINATKLYKKALQIAANTKDARSTDYRAIIMSLKTALDERFTAIRKEVEKANSESTMQIYHGFGDNLIVHPEELYLEYYAKHFVKAA
jgi:hypothetical protein